MIEEWEQIAKDADDGLAAKLAWLLWLAENNRVQSLSVGVKYLNDKGVPVEFVWYPKDMLSEAVGLAALQLAQWQHNFVSAPGLSEDEANSYEDED